MEFSNKGRPLDAMQREDWGQSCVYHELDHLSELIRELSWKFVPDEPQEFADQMWALFGRAYEAGRLNPVETVQDLAPALKVVK